jgi:hypothetical protein
MTGPVVENMATAIGTDRRREWTGLLFTICRCERSLKEWWQPMKGFGNAEAPNILAMAPVAERFGFQGRRRTDSCQQGRLYCPSDRHRLMRIGSRCKMDSVTSATGNVSASGAKRSRSIEIRIFRYLWASLSPRESLQEYAHSVHVPLPAPLLFHLRERQVGRARNRIAARARSIVTQLF